MTSSSSSLIQWLNRSLAPSRSGGLLVVGAPSPFFLSLWWMHSYG